VVVVEELKVEELVMPEPLAKVPVEVEVDISPLVEMVAKVVVER
jgi:hypothetical protein|tara:strand:- start:427 stop:558 length:132 start_codon:yes stop_codon:yes gene_type:complete